MLRHVVSLCLSCIALQYVPVLYTIKELAEPIAHCRLTSSVASFLIASFFKYREVTGRRGRRAANRRLEHLRYSTAGWRSRADIKSR